jgi:5-formyltetrahydrofolate cyclo-ligase
MDIILQKNSLRKEFKAKRASLTESFVAEQSKKICDNFINNLFPQIYQKNLAQNFSLYLSSNNEVDTSHIRDFFIKNHINFSYPKITNLNYELDFIAFKPDTKFTNSQFFKKVAEPQNGEKILPDILIMPLLAFDGDLQRLGMGGGFFDRTIAALKNKKSKIITIGLAYGLQRFDGNLPTENTDATLDFIVCEDVVILKK